MKKLQLLVLALLCCGAVKAQLPSTDLFEQLVLKINTGPTPANYGTSPDQPITVGAFVYMTDDAKMNRIMGKFSRSFLWPDGTMIDYNNRERLVIKGVNLDRYTIVQTGKKDTMRLYVDMYNEGPVYVPKGLTAYTKQMLATALAPIITDIKKMNTAANRYTDSAAKATSFQMISFAQKTVGLDYLMDKDYLDPILNDNGVDLDLKAYLVRSYMFHKLELAAADAPAVKDKAFNAMVNDFNQAYKANPNFVVGSLVTTLKPKG